MKIASLQETSLTLMHDKDQLTADQVINVEPMEIKTFKIELQK